MKSIIATLITLASCNVLAFSFITEAQVQTALDAKKVIEISTQTVRKIGEEGSSCSDSALSKSARAYVVKKDNKSFIYITTEKLSDLELCGEI